MNLANRVRRGSFSAWNNYCSRWQSSVSSKYLTYFPQATDSEELTIAEGEELEILERDGDGWCKVKLYTNVLN